MGVIYSIRFPGSPNRYVGSTKKMERRESTHRWMLRNGTHHCRALQNAAWKYGIDSMIIDLLQIDVRDEWLTTSEQYWLDHFVGHLYNRHKIATARGLAGPNTGLHLIGNQHRKGIPHSIGDKAKISAGLKRAFAEGRRRESGANLQRYREKVANGSVPHPTKRSAAMVRDTLEHLATTRSVKATGAHFGMTGENVRAILRNASAVLAEMEIFSPPLRCAHRKFIHPDWLDLLEA